MPQQRGRACLAGVVEGWAEERVGNGEQLASASMQFSERYLLAKGVDTALHLEGRGY
jgi:hypothetical protein